MIANRNFETCTPLTWFGSFPVYLATALAAAHGVTMILTALAMAAGRAGMDSPYLAPFLFSWQTSALEGRLWQFLTYAFVNPPSIWVVIQLVLLAMFGAQVEKFLGRNAFLWLYVTLLLAGPLLLCVLGLFGVGWVLSGSATLHFAVFIAFVLIYPRAEIFFGIQARWIAAVLMGLYTLQGVAMRDMFSVGILWWECLAALVYLRWEGVGAFALPELPKIEHSERPKKRKAKPHRQADEEKNLHESIDPILEKISRTGISSLTRSERERLERARATLLEEEKKPR